MYSRPQHLAQWVATMILVQSRPRPRSELVAKFVLVAGELRRLEDFNSLQGVLAGLNNQAVHRLSETFDMATNQLDGDSSVAIKDGAPRLPKKLRSLQLLMAPTRSFAAYRLALSASIGSTTLPYMGVILQDLIVVNETASDLEEGLVNWSKFSRLGESAAVLLDLPRNPPDFPVDRTLERYILDSPVLDEDVRLRTQARRNGSRLTSHSYTAPVRPLLLVSASRRGHQGALAFSRLRIRSRAVRINAICMATDRLECLYAKSPPSSSRACSESLSTLLPTGEPRR